jgi:hypothetical protein
VRAPSPAPTVGVPVGVPTPDNPEKRETGVGHKRTRAKK